METVDRKVKIGTRGSALATQQAKWVKRRLEESCAGVSVELIFIKTRGDKIQDVPLAKVGGKGLFVKEIEEALIERRVDIAVHSMKDVPAEIPEGLTIGAIPPREDPRDVLVTRVAHAGIQDLPPGSKVGTSSLRRHAQILYLRPDVKIESLRGNLDTRLRKLRNGDFDAIVLAAAGLHRMGWEAEITSYLSPDEFLPAIGQGALGIEMREDDEEIRKLVSRIHDSNTAICIEAERKFLARLEGGCQVPIGGYCEWEKEEIKLTGMVSSTNGKEFYRESLRGKPGEAADMGKKLGDILLSKGARKILAEVYGNQRL